MEEPGGDSGVGGGSNSGGGSGGDSGEKKRTRVKVKVKVKVRKGRRVAPGGNEQQTDFAFLDPREDRRRRGKSARRTMSVRMGLGRKGKQEASAARASEKRRKAARKTAVKAEGGASEQPKEMRIGSAFQLSQPPSRLGCGGPSATGAAVAGAGGDLEMGAGLGEGEDGEADEEYDGPESTDARNFWMDVMTCNMDMLDWCVLTSFVVNVAAIAIAVHLLANEGTDTARKTAFFILGALGFIWCIIYHMERNGGWYM